MKKIRLAVKTEALSKIAISAAMPGLVGEIFRKDGVHASLRTTTAGKLSSADAPETSITIRLKLFNMIARERNRPQGLLPSENMLLLSIRDSHDD
ncbi:MAG TPA: hypothetical protein EYH36_10155 [Desulfocapsa sulfexigens]|nr:hypothetical protein [Desulfocapsa sulfexigens]